MSDTNDRYKKAQSRPKTKPARRVGVSADAKKAYEDLVRHRDEREKNYGRHLPSPEKREK